MPKTVTITEEEYDSLNVDSLKLLALESAGCDNWSGYDDAMELFENMLKEYYD